MKSKIMMLKLILLNNSILMKKEISQMKIIQIVQIIIIKYYNHLVNYNKLEIEIGENPFRCKKIVFLMIKGNNQNLIKNKMICIVLLKVLY